jgi:aspartate/methionine/tyrosine aminotransferase
MIVGKLRQIPGVKLAEPQGAFYVLPEMSNFFGPGGSGRGEEGARNQPFSYCQVVGYKRL